MLCGFCACLLSDRGNFLLFLVCWIRFIMKGCWILSNAFFLCLLRLSCGFCPLCSPSFRLHHLYQSIVFANSSSSSNLLFNNFSEFLFQLLSFTTPEFPFSSFFFFYQLIFPIWWHIVTMPSFTSFNALIFVIAALKPLKAIFVACSIVCLWATHVPVYFHVSTLFLLSKTEHFQWYIVGSMNTHRPPLHPHGHSRCLPACLLIY